VLGDFDAARSLLEEGLAVRRELGDEVRMASSLSNLGIVAFEQGDLDDAEARFVEALELDRAHGNEWGAGAALDNLAAVAIERGDSGRARELNREVLVSAQRVGDQELIAFGLEKAAILAATAEQAARAGRLAGAADAVREAAGIDRNEFDRGWLDRHLSRVAGDEFETDRAAGKRIEPEEALREALEG
jgi:tetratricopeptide (TPR) repeat protein